MRHAKVSRYYCDFCSRGWFKAQKCLAHEGSCVQNPDRICGVCERYELNQVPTQDIVFFLGQNGLNMPSLRGFTNGCPMCMLAGVMAVNKLEGWNRRSEEHCNFDYRAEMKRFDEEHGVPVEGADAFNLD